MHQKSASENVELLHASPIACLGANIQAPKYILIPFDSRPVLNANGVDGRILCEVRRSSPRARGRETRYG